MTIIWTKAMLLKSCAHHWGLRLMESYQVIISFELSFAIPWALIQLVHTEGMTGIQLAPKVACFSVSCKASICQHEHEISLIER